MFSIEGESDTYRNLLDVPEFVVNFVTVDLAEKMEMTACRMPRDEDEFLWAKLTPSSSKRVAPPRVSEAKASLECRVLEIKSIGNIPNYVVFGEVIHFAVDAAIWNKGRVDPHRYTPIGRLSGGYVTHGDLFKLSRPQWVEVQQQTVDSALDLVRRKDA
jgi:flavin reductase (DIM6/NTAB) family NADH-FMN oxidoreductase RutF